MKEIEHTIISKLLTKDYCSPKIATLAGKLHIPNTTIHYNVKKMEDEGKIIGYKAVFNSKKIERGFCVIAHMKLDGKSYNDMESFVKFAKRIAINEEVESVDIVTGEWELIVKIRAKDQDEYFSNLQKIIEKAPIIKVNSMVSLKQIKSEYVLLPDD